MNEFLQRYIEENVIPKLNPVSIADSLTESITPLTKYVVKPIEQGIRGAIGSSLLKGNDNILTEERNPDGSLKTNLLDDYLLVSPEDKAKQGLSLLNSRQEYSPLRRREFKEGKYNFKDGSNLKNQDTIDDALAFVESEDFKKYESEGGDLTKIDLDSTTPQQLSVLTSNLDNSNTIRRLSPGTDTSSMSRFEIQALAENLRDEAENKKKLKDGEVLNKIQAGDPLTQSTIARNLAQSGIERAKVNIDRDRLGLDRTDRDRNFKLGLLGAENELQIAQNKLAFDEATLISNARQRELDREFYDRRDQRLDNRERARDRQDLMDKIFAALLGGSKLF